MARARDPNRDKAFKIFKEHNGDITNRAIAEILMFQKKQLTHGNQNSKDNRNEKLNGALQTSIKNVKRERRTLWDGYV
ncbi:phage terminase small subunit-related protein [Lysinibacillus sp. FSL R7-0073]|uniref:phage terminase small subunit-related protein n=1 Tax=Lysinibacillus TaxID=400634 RepID=UPI002E23C111|nr:phage terminase small subunit-related protein [Lysinibacillus fusiformis]